jgi:hypothetical protein
MDKLDLVVDRIDDLKESTDKRLESIDKNLAEHMRRTDILEQLHRDNQQRIAMLEEPRKALILIKQVALWISAICGCILAVLKMLGKI